METEDRMSGHHLGRGWGTKEILLQLSTTITHFLSPPHSLCDKFVQGTISNKLWRNSQSLPRVSFFFVNVTERRNVRRTIHIVDLGPSPHWPTFRLITDPLSLIIFCSHGTHQNIGLQIYYSWWSQCNSPHSHPKFHFLYQLWELDFSYRNIERSLYCQSFCPGPACWTGTHFRCSFLVSVKCCSMLSRLHSGWIASPQQTVCTSKAVCYSSSAWRVKRAKSKMSTLSSGVQKTNNFGKVLFQTLAKPPLGLIMTWSVINFACKSYLGKHNSSIKNSTLSDIPFI